MSFSGCGISFIWGSGCGILKRNRGEIRIESMLGRRDAKDNPRGYGIARNFGSGLRDWKTVLGTRWIGLSPIHTNPNTFETVYFFILFGLHTKPVNPLTDTKRESFSLADTADFWNRSSERIFWIRRFWWICVDDRNRDIFEVHYAGSVCTRLL